jgi:phospholipase C
LLSANPNAVPPFRLDRRQAFQCTNQHAYTHQQLAMHGGLMDRFVEALAPTKPGCSRRQVMGYFDGNTVTGLWNYAQHFALGDNFFATTIGRSTPGAINLVSGQTHGATPAELAGVMIPDYTPYHEPFQYYTSTANPHHLPPSSVAMVGHSDRANHQYDLTDFWRAAQRGDLPSVSFLKARHFQDGHDGKSDPLDEQVFLVETINRLQRLRAWRSMAIVIAYDDPGGWYDHVFPPILSQSNDARYDALLGSGLCGQPTRGRTSTAAVADCVSRCWRSRRGPNPIPSITRSWIRLPSCASSRRTGAWAGSATIPSTPPPAH